MDEEEWRKRLFRAFRASPYLHLGPTFRRGQSRTISQINHTRMYQVLVHHPFRAATDNRHIDLQSQHIAAAYRFDSRAW